MSSCIALYIFNSRFPCEAGGCSATADKIVLLTSGLGTPLDHSRCTLKVVSSNSFIPTLLRADVKHIGVYDANLNFSLTCASISFLFSPEDFDKSH